MMRNFWKPQRLLHSLSQTAATQFFFTCFLMGCAPLKHNALPPECVPQTERQIQAHTHWLYTIVPRHRAQIQPYDIGHRMTWMLFGNDDNGLFGETHNNIFENEPITAALAMRWFIRNPLHNFTGYVIGSQNTPQSETVLLSIGEKHQFLNYSLSSSPQHHEDLFFCGFHGWKPFISLTVPFSHNKKGRCYMGWRSHGSFGLKLNISSRYTPSKEGNHDQ